MNSTLNHADTALIQPILESAVRMGPRHKARDDGSLGMTVCAGE